MNKNEIYQIHGTDYKDMTIRLLEQAGLEEEIRAKTGGRDNPCIGIKPNLVCPTPASFGATTHPEIVAGILEYLAARGFSNLMICEGSWVGDKTEEAFEYCGYRELAEKYGVTLLDTQKDGSLSVTSRKGPEGRREMELHICRCLSDIDYLINVPVLKGHCQTKITCALKNMKGLIPNSEKRRFHSLGLHGPIAHLNTVIRQDFIVVDHICGDPDFEEGGNPMVTNCIMAAKDPVLTDALACRILHYRPEEVEYIKTAESLGVGSADLSCLQLISLDNPSRKETPKPDSIASYSHRMLELNYAIEEIESCSACYSALIQALDRLQAEGLLQNLTEQKNIRFCIGQGYRESDGSGCQDAIRIGIGNCTRKFEKNIPGCPPTEDEIYQYLLDWAR